MMQKITLYLGAFLWLLAGLTQAQAQRNAFGEQHTLAIHPDGTLWAWGVNYGGQLGIAGTLYQARPTQVGTAST
jgi:alpha-tubulin suppressor-like RCC1 family protein